MRHILLVLVTCLLIAPLQAQVTQSQVDAKLGVMTQSEIDAKLKELGITSEEAQARAKALGVDVSSYLRGTVEPAADIKTPPVTLTTPVQTAYPADADSREGARAPRWYESPEGVLYFGYNVFDGIPSAFEPTAAGPADPQYLIGPEDGLRLVVWGQAEFQYDLTVDKEGRIFIPTVGQILVSGLTLEKAYQRLLSSLSRSYSGLVGKNPTVWMDLSISRLRPKRIFVLGEVRKPGGYTVHSYATAFNSLYAVGGPTLKGSLREIRILRDSKVITRVDLYNYLTGMEETNDIRVQTDDQIYVPVRGKTVVLLGEVKRPAIYELKAGETLDDVLRFAGGFTAQAHIDRIKIRRILPPADRILGLEERVELDIDYAKSLQSKKKIELKDGDEISVRAVIEYSRNYVTLAGAVNRPGTYQLERFPTLRKVIEGADSVRREVYLGRTEVTRLLQDSTRMSYHFNLGDILAGKSDFPLEPLDHIYVYGRTEIVDKEESFQVRGAVRNGGTFALSQNTSVLDALLKAGGPQETANVNEVSVMRRRNPNTPEDTLSYEIDVPIFFWRGEREPDRVDSTIHTETKFRLQNRDIVVVRPDRKKIPQRIYTISGEVRRPGSYALVRQNVRLSDALREAGGTLATAYLGGASLRRGNDPVRVDFEAAVRNPGGDEDVVLHDADEIVVPLIPSTVRVSGEVGNPGLYGFVNGWSMMDYIDRAGGFTDSSHHIYFSMPSGLTEQYGTGWLRSAFEGDPTVPDGSTILVTKEPRSSVEPVPFDLGATIRDTMAIIASALTIMVLAGQIK